MAVDATAFARSKNRNFQTAEEGFRSRPRSSTKNEINRLRSSLKGESIKSIYNTARSLGVDLPKGIGRDSAIDVIVNEFFSRTNIPIERHKGTFTLEKKLPGGGRFGLYANPKDRSGGLSLTKPLGRKKGGLVKKKKGMGTKWERKWG